MARFRLPPVLALAALSPLLGCLTAPALENTGMTQAGPPEGEPLPAAAACAGAELSFLTWNVMWLGDPARGPSDERTQLARVTEVLASAPADLIALQEVADVGVLAPMLDTLQRYEAVWTTHPWPQQMALLYRRERFELDASSQLYDLSSAGRSPLAVALRDAHTQAPLYVVVLHAKANADHAAWLERERLSEQLAAHLALRPANEARVVLGDFNDELSDSILDGAPTPYGALLDLLDAPTMQLERSRGEASTVWGSVIDHVLLSATLARAATAWRAESLRDELLVGEPLFTSQVSDHFPVTLRATGCDG